MGCSSRIKRVVFDTSILMLLYDSVPVFEEVSRVLESLPECIITRQVLAELEKIAENSTSEKKRAARLALEAIEKHKCRVVEVEARDADESIIEYVLFDREAIAATADRELRRRLRKKGVPNIYYRESMHGLMLEG